MPLKAWNLPFFVKRRIVRWLILLGTFVAIGLATPSINYGGEKSTSSPTFIPSRIEDLAAKRAKVNEQIARLTPTTENSAETSEQIAQSGATSDVEEELDLLKTLDLLYLQHQALIEQRAEADNQKRRLEGEIDALRNFGPPEAKPYSFLLLEDLRDQLSAEAARREASESDLSAAHQMLEQAREQFDDDERERRRAQEELEENSDTQQDKELTRASKLAALQSSISQETVVLRRMEIELKTVRQESCELRKTLLDEKVERIEKDVKFTERDLKLRQADLSRFAQEMKRKLKDAEVRLQQLDIQQAKSVREFSEQSTDKSITVAASDAFLVARRTAHEEITMIQERLGELDRFRHYWDCRYDVVNGKADRDDLTTWQDNLNTFLERLQQTERSLALRLDEIQVDQATLFRRSREFDGDESSQMATPKKWIDFQVESLQRLAELCQTSSLHLKSSQRSVQRFLQDLEERIEPEEDRDWMGPIRESFQSVWEYEIASVDDRPITVGKIVRALTYLLIGMVLARLVSRTLGNRILPRFGLNEGAAHAVQSISFYTMCVLFAVLALELVNLPFAAFTFLGGAAAIGLGFGSQNILNNFISGLILLAEQPIRVGDLVEIDGIQGMVEHIGARSTRVKTVSNHEILIPNSALLEKRFTNLTLTDDLVQTAVGVTLSPGMTVEDARQSLLRAAASHPKVLRDPAPVVLFKEFNATAMSFELHFWLQLQSVMECRIVESEVRESLNKLFRNSDTTSIAVAITPASPIEPPGKKGPTSLSSKPTRLAS